MKAPILGVYYPNDLPASFSVVANSVVAHIPSDKYRVIKSGYIPDLAQADVLWDTRAGGGVPPLVELLDLKIPMVLTLHGVAPLSQPWLYSDSIRSYMRTILQNRYKRQQWSLLDSQVHRIVAVSNFTRKDACRRLRLNFDNISVVPHGVDRDVAKLTPKTPRDIPSGPYFLHVSNYEPRKNVKTILRAFRRLSPSERWPLVLKLPQPTDFGDPDIFVVSGHLPRSELSALYSCAGAFVFPSLYEGFGLPILEAMALECPVITSYDTACAETAGDAALLVNPRNTSALSAAMWRVMSHPSCAGDLRSKGVARAAEFSWHSAAMRYIQIFDDVLSSTLPKIDRR